MFRMKKRSYRVFEGLRVATLVSYIGGFIDAYTYNTQDGRFASIQTGNLLYLVIHLVEGHIARAFSYVIPIFFFVLGQFFVFFVKCCPAYVPRCQTAFHLTRICQTYYSQ